MSKQTRIARCRTLFDQLQSLAPHEYDGWQLAMTDFDGLSYEESKRTFRLVLNVFEGLNSNDSWAELTWHALNSLEGLIQNVYNMFAQLKNSRDQSSFQNFVQNLDSLAYHLRLFGAVDLALGGANLERAATTIKSELESLTVARSDVEGLKAEVQKLIAPAVAGSLSEAFTARKTVLLWGRIAWGVIALLVGGYCIYATYDVASAVGVALAVAKTQPQGADVLWATLLLRSIVLLPLYAAFGFCFAQYKKERDFEEEYAHKAAVATSLPNYGDLTREPAVRDQIVTGATNVIFTAPTSRPQEVERSEKVLGSVKEIVDSFGKLLSKKGDA